MDYEIATELGEKPSEPEFQAQQDRIIVANKQMLPKLDRSGQRAQHPKAHATLDATVTTLELDDADKALQVGVFATPGETRQAVIRFSNSSKMVDNPKGGDAHGMAIKLFGVPGQKFEPDPDLHKAPTQHERHGTADFILINNETFFEGDLKDYGQLNDLSGELFAYTRSKRNRLAGLLAMIRVYLFIKFTKPEMGKAITATGDQVPVNPLYETFFSTTPYLLGPDHAVKYMVRPVFKTPPFKEQPLPVKNENYLGQRMRRALLERDHKFQLWVQVKTADDKQFPIDNPRQPWTGAREVALANIEIPKLGELSDAEWQMLRFGQESRRYNIWNTTKDHRPLGQLNRLRREVYKELHRTRVSLDGDVYNKK